MWRLARTLSGICVGLAAWVGPAPPAAAAAAPAASGQLFKLLVETAGVYRVGHEDLVAAGLEPGGVASAGLALSGPEGAVPVWVEDGGDGTLDPGDWIEFVGEHPRGERTYLSEHSRYNVYFLRLDGGEAVRMRPAAAVPAGGAADAGPFQALERTRHFERDLLLLRLPPLPDGPPDELWYWAKLAHNRAEPWTATLDLGDLEPSSAGSVTLRVRLRGWSRPRAKADPELPDHRVEVALNGAGLGVAEWSGPAPHLLEVPAIPADRWAAGDNLLELRVPARTMGAEATTLIDVVMLDWIEVVYPHDGLVGDGQARFDRAGGGALPIRLRRQAAGPVRVYGLGGARVAAAGDAGTFVVAAAGERSFFAARPEALLAPAAVELDRPSALRDPANRADYLMIAHRRLLGAVEPLAELHRSRGLEVAVVDVQDVYDEFNHGVVHPRALRSFVEHAYRRWARPTPRFVLLVGDASWDGKNTLVEDENYADWTYRPGETLQFVKNRSTPYATGGELNNRHLVPTWNLPTYEGHSASDNWFVAVDGEDTLPDLAIGRFPVVEPAEVARIVAKSIHYARAGEVGPWRRNVLFITNESRGLKRQSDGLASLAAARGLAPRRVYPESSEVSNEGHTRSLVDAFDEGQLIVHFIGHGGRYIWRTGPPDLEKNHDLFTLDDLERLRPTGRLPVVLSMTCYSAPFDHPSADSIGEKLLRLDERGAVAVVAASWRNAPQTRWGWILIDELLRPGTTIGEAVMRAKHRIGELGVNRSLVETYNLLGDPALPMARPDAGIELAAAGDPGGVAVEGRVGLPGFAGRLIVELVGGRGEAIRSRQLELGAPEFAIRLEASAEELAAAVSVRAYAWNAQRGRDAAGAVELPPAPASPAAAAAGDR